MSGSVNLAYDYPLLGAFWTILWISLWVLWFILLFRVIADVFRDDDLGGWGKAGWIVFVIVLPFLGVFVYLLARGEGMGRRERRHVQAQQEAMNTYIRETAGSGASEAEQLAKLSEIRARGDITDEEFAAAKAKILH
ncbi:hypothetical protein ACZ90_68070 [Streptomyces albus subsp. albus]|nr:hypothetical protein ACZ90_68070 [Streptomyces albus subsp. albus]